MLRACADTRHDGNDELGCGNETGEKGHENLLKHGLVQEEDAHGVHADEGNNGKAKRMEAFVGDAPKYHGGRKNDHGTRFGDVEQLYAGSLSFVGHVLASFLGDGVVLPKF